MTGRFNVASPSIYPGLASLGLGKRRITRKAGFREKRNVHRVLELGSASDPMLSRIS